MMGHHETSGAWIDVREGEGPPLLLVHGLMTSRAQWTPNLVALANVCRPVTLELLGHGRSQTPADPQAYAVDAYLARFEALRADLGVDRWLVCGQSFGAGLTLRYALAYPNRVIGQIFTNTMAALSSTLGNTTRRAEAVRAGGRQALEAQANYPRPSSRLAPALWRGIVEDAAMLSVEGVANAIEHTAPGLSVRADLGRFDVPTLLANGVREAAFQPFRDLALAELPGLQVVDLDAGHGVNISAAEGFNDAVSAFVRATIGATPAAAAGNATGYRQVDSNSALKRKDRGVCAAPQRTET